MAIKDFDDMSELTIDVYLKNGKKYLDCDIPSGPQSPDSCIAFWVGEELMVVPLDNVDHYCLKRGETK